MIENFVLIECERRCTSRHRSQNYQADVNNNNLLDSEVDAFRTPQIVITTAEPSQNAESPAVVEENDNGIHKAFLNKYCFT